LAFFIWFKMAGSTLLKGASVEKSCFAIAIARPQPDVLIPQVPFGLSAILERRPVGNTRAKTDRSPQEIFFGKLALLVLAVFLLLPHTITICFVPRAANGFQRLSYRFGHGMLSSASFDKNEMTILILEQDKQKRGGYLMASFLQVFTTTDSKKNAQDMARVLVEGRLAGCVQIFGPITSVYRWEGKVQDEEEWLCIIKSKERCFDRLCEAITEIHPYDTPEIIATDIAAGSADYFQWLAGALKPLQ
jgi:periplasmic divalent cation tolerance protein